VTKKEDEETVRNALRRLRSLALSHRYGGLGDAYKEAKEVIEAFDRLVKPAQDKLL